MLQAGARSYNASDATVKAYAQQRAAAAEAQEEDALLNEVAGLKTFPPPLLPREYFTRVAMLCCCL